MNFAFEDYSFDLSFDLIEKIILAIILAIKMIIVITRIGTYKFFGIASVKIRTSKIRTKIIVP